MRADARMAKRCFYEVLGVERSADEGELKSACRKLSMKWHPDRNPGDKNCEARFKEINEAYEILKDPDKRAAYDRFGHAAFEHGGPGGPRRVWCRFRLRILRSVRRYFRNGRSPRALRPGAWRRPALQHGDQAGGGVFGKNRTRPHPRISDLRILLWLRSKGGHPAEGLPELRRPGPYPPCPGLFYSGEDLPELSGPRPACT